MVLQSLKTGISSNATTGGVLKNTNNSIISYIPVNLFDNPGFLIIKGVGFVSGGSNPSNNIPDELSIVFNRPNISTPTTTQFFNKVFTNTLTSFEFEIKIACRLNGGSVYVSVLHQDGTLGQFSFPNGLNPDTFYEIYLNHTSTSTLYSIFVDSVISEFKSFGG